jgi:hypothetical protein
VLEPGNGSWTAPESRRAWRLAGNSEVGPVQRLAAQRRAARTREEALLALQVSLLHAGIYPPHMGFRPPRHAPRRGWLCRETLLYPSSSGGFPPRQTRRITHRENRKPMCDGYNVHEPTTRRSPWSGRLPFLDSTRSCISSRFLRHGDVTPLSTHVSRRKRRKAKTAFLLSVLVIADEMNRFPSVTPDLRSVRLCGSPPRVGRMDAPPFSMPAAR